MIMVKCLHGSAPAYLANYCTSTSLVSGRSALRYAAHDCCNVVLSLRHRTDWGLRQKPQSDDIRKKLKTYCIQNQPVNSCVTLVRYCNSLLTMLL